MTDEQIRLILGRDENPLPLPDFTGRRILVTGANGSIGIPLVTALIAAGASVQPTDIGTLDVRDGHKVRTFISDHDPDLIIHLAAMKYAPEGEINPLETVATNVTGTANVLSWGTPTVAVSTCKAIAPETVYGASKLIAERMTLNHGGVVARLYNVVPAIGNVFETWASIPRTDSVPVTACLRHFISANEAVSILMNASVQPSGRYTIDPGAKRHMPNVAHDLGRECHLIPRRRGDRAIEPLAGAHEVLTKLPNGLLRIDNSHDAVRMAEAA